jgi:polyisoprenoid-binding protein YceI
MPDTIRVLTYKDGLLARLAHDLRLHVERFTIAREGEQLRVEIDPSSLVIDGVMKDGRCDASALSAGDRATIGETIRSTILDVRRHPSIRVQGRLITREDGSVELRGELELRGSSGPLVLVGRREGTRVRASTSVRPSEFGIAPYKALAGAIKLQDRVGIEIELDAASLAETSGA